MKLGRTAVYSGLITLSKTLVGFISTKVIAILIGPAGVAVVGAFINFIAIILAFGNGAINNGIVKYTAEYAGNDTKSFKLFNTALYISIFCSVVCLIILVAFSGFFSKIIFNTDIYTNIIICFGLTIIFYSLNTLLISILNGRGLINIYTIINTLGSFISLVVTCCLVYFFRVEGALYALIMTQTILFFVCCYFFFKKTSYTVRDFKPIYNKIIGKKLFQYSFMAIVSALTVPVSQIIIRNIIINLQNIDEAGIWQGIMRVSDAYLLIILTALGTYYLPKLSSLKTNDLIRKEVLYGYKYIIPITAVGLVIVYFLRFFIIRLLYSEQFYEMTDLFLWQLVGDFFKITAYLLAYIMLAKAQMKIYIITEIIFSFTYVVFSYFFVKRFGLVGATYAFALNYFCYMIVLFIYFKDLLLKKDAIFKF
ncbi:multidrug transporter MatE [Chryseobacterium sp. CBo1]|uniref:O-antigen translocase n=1 Tax=Chryseobacterium sp. CBo1 TaxID=1869230 RepID=UPI0008106377|nr:O-antigen translocase [Chryseobacterium sp. CBo1]OCK52672.1 multidrug transporter MatE [Chryseobacterium sp. CBo1]